jgi:hypothetical protein
MDSTSFITSSHSKLICFVYMLLRFHLTLYALSLKQSNLLDLRQSMTSMAARQITTQLALSMVHRKEIWTK